MFIAHVCPLCGGKLERKEDSYFCEFCSTTFEEDKAERFTDSISKLLDGEKQENLANLKNLLWVELHEKKYVDSDRILELTKDILKLYPDDYIANFFYTANNNEISATAEKISKFDVRNYGYAVEWVLDFVIKSLEPVYILPTSDLIERAFKNKNLDKYHDYSSRLSREAEKVENGIYDLALPRQVFVCYSSADMPKVLDLVNTLEDEGISCFVAARNLRHGAGAVQNYKDAIKTAIDYCNVLVFVSSTNSRKASCDACEFEIPYVRSKDLSKAPAEYSHDYANMPAVYKKPRVEYLVEEYKNKISETTVKEFFSGNEWCYTKEDVTRIVFDILRNGWAKPIVDNEKLLTAQVKRDKEYGQDGIITKENSTPVKKQKIDDISHIIKREGCYLWFGSYPQSEIKDNATKSALKNLAGPLPTSIDSQKWTSYRYYIDSSRRDYTWYIDIEYSGKKYRGVYFNKYRTIKTSSKIQEDAAFQKDNAYVLDTIYWFVYEPIKWRTLKDENGELLLLSEKIIDSQQYCHYISNKRFDHNEGKGYPNNYAFSDIRKWLNFNFYNTAFTDSEKGIIKNTTVDNSITSVLCKKTGCLKMKAFICNDTHDKVFLLSSRDVIDDNYGFDIHVKNDDANRVKKCTDYAKAQGVASDVMTYSDEGNWWLRSPSNKRNRSCIVTSDGGSRDTCANLTDFGVVPALIIELS